MFKVIKEDFRNNSINSFIVLFSYRLSNGLYRQDFKILAWIVDKFFSIIKCLLSSGSQISYKALIGKRLRLPHKAFGVVISKYAIIGDDCTIFHLVTLGINENKDDKRITIGNNCYLSVGAKVISCSLNDGVILTPNSVVYQNVEKPGIVKP